MSKASHHTGWPVLAGIVLVVLGVRLLLTTFLGPLLYPLAWLFGLLARVGWPLLLIGIGILLIIRARGGGFNVTGKRLYRSRTNRMIGGVLGGLSAYLNIDVTVLRVIFAILTLVTGVWWGVLLYVAAMIVVPEEQWGASWTGAPWTADRRPRTRPRRRLRRRQFRQRRAAPRRRLPYPLATRKHRARRHRFPSRRVRPTRPRRPRSKLMDPETISKKELLVVAGISYGQLYRWKRKGLIPEDWFQRKSTFTGQETFFPREKVLARVEKIKAMQDEDASLDEIADAVAPNLGEVSMTLSEVREHALVSPEAAELFAEGVRDRGAPLVFGEVVSLAALDTLLKTGDVSLEEGRVVLGTLQENYPAFEGRSADLLFVRRMGLSAALLVTSGAEVRFDQAARVVSRINLSESAEALRAKIR